MLSAVKLKLSSSSPHFNGSFLPSSRRSSYALNLPTRRFASLSLQHDYISPSLSSPPPSDHYTSTVGSSTSPTSAVHVSQWSITQRHILLLNIIASAVAISATWLFFSAIPTLLAFKRAAESLEKLMDVTREELPDTMAALRLSGMEISDLTMELSDLGQEITKGVKKSTRTVRMAEERLSSLTNRTPSASSQDVTSLTTTEAGGPPLARAARGMREGIVKGHSMLQIFFTFSRFSRMVFSYFANRSKRHPGKLIS